MLILDELKLLSLLNLLHHHIDLLGKKMLSRIDLYVTLHQLKLVEQLVLLLYLISVYLSSSFHLLQTELIHHLLICQI